MPIYEYQCNGCGHRLEKIQKMLDEPLKNCPVCSKATLKKLVSAAGFRLKGAGWYETDFKTGSKKHGTGSDESNTKSTESGGDTGKSDSGSSSKEAPPEKTKKSSSGGAASDD